MSKNRREEEDAVAAAKKSKGLVTVKRVSP
jgi:hypothetical protein